VWPRSPEVGAGSADELGGHRRSVDERIAFVNDHAARLSAPGETASIDEHATVELARRSLEAAVDALRDLRAQQHHAERLVRHALDALRQLPQPATAAAGTLHESPFLSVAEVAEIVGVSRRQAWRMVRDGTVPSCKLGQRVVVARAALKEWEEALGGQGLG
jgi:excisionase family DNA binding protein